MANPEIKIRFRALPADFIAEAVLLVGFGELLVRLQDGGET